MYTILRPKQDATIYEKHPYRNTGIDQILELTKFTIGESVDDVISSVSRWDRTYNSRILLQFNFNDIINQINSNYIDYDTLQAYLSLHPCEVVSLANEFEIYAHPLTQSWVTGNGNYYDNPEITNGVSWYYTSGDSSEITWSPDSGSMFSTSVSGGGSWNSSLVASQSFELELPQVYMNVTDIVKAWVTGSIPNNGFIVKYTNEIESNDLTYGSIKFFSRETHTVYVPTLHVYWNNPNNVTGSNIPLVNESYTIFISELKSKYRVGEIVKLRVYARDKFVTNSYTRRYNSLDTLRLPENTQFSIVDSATGVAVVPFNELGTRVEIDSLGNYITLNLTNMFPERVYKIVFKVIDGHYINIIDDNITFKVGK